MIALLLGQRGERVLVGDRAPQERGDGILLDLLQARRDAGLAEILLRQDVGGDLRPEFRHLDVVGLEHHRAVRIADLAGGQAERDVRVGRLAVLGVAPFNPHVFLAPNCRTVGHRPFVFDGLVLRPPPLLELVRRTHPHLGPMLRSGTGSIRGFCPGHTTNPCPKTPCSGVG